MIRRETKEGYGNIFSASSRKNGHAPNPYSPRLRYWIFSGKTRTNLPSYTMTAVVFFFFIFPPDPTRHAAATAHRLLPPLCSDGVIYKFADPTAF